MGSILRVLELLDNVMGSEEIQTIRNKTSEISQFIYNQEDISDKDKKFIHKELQQIAEAFTAERANYYLKRLKKSLTIEKKNKLNDLNLNRWKDYDDILTDSLWLLDSRDNKGGHSAHYWGNFVPQIPRQLMLRYTKEKEFVLDPFLGSGTTLIECKHLNRNGIGFELQESVLNNTRKDIDEIAGSSSSQIFTFQADSSQVDYQKLLNEVGVKSVQLAILHPPYWDIIRFSEDKTDLSNAASMSEFLEQFGAVIERTASVLDKGRFMAIVISDKYNAGEWIPLGFYCMLEAQKRGFLLKSTIVKNFEETKGKRNQQEIWRYRALVGGFYIFKHEYIFILQKK